MSTTPGEFLRVIIGLKITSCSRDDDDGIDEAETDKAAVFLGYIQFGGEEPMVCIRSTDAAGLT